MGIGVMGGGLRIFEFAGGQPVGLWEETMHAFEERE